MHNDYVHESQIHLHHKTICRKHEPNENAKLNMPNCYYRRRNFFRCSFNLLLLRWHFYVGIVSMKTGVQYKIRGERAPFAGYTVFFIFLSLILLLFSLTFSGSILSGCYVLWDLWMRCESSLKRARDASKVLIFYIFWHYTRL